MYKDLNLFELERMMIPVNQWHTAPDPVRKITEEGEAEGVPSGIAFHPTLGWFGLCSAGQGPMITAHCDLNGVNMIPSAEDKDSDDNGF